MRTGTASSQRWDARAAFDDALLVGAPAVTAFLLAVYVARHEFAVDFQHQYWVVAHRLLSSGSPYSWTHSQITSGVGAFPYPAPAALLFAPFGLLSRGLAAAIWVAGSMAALVGALRLLSVRDWRLYSLAFVWWPVIIGWQSGNMTLLLVLLIALAWRHRDQPLIAALLTAVLISLKPYVWPLEIWLLGTRRYRAAAWAIPFGLALNLLAWGLIGFDQFSRYIRLDADVTETLYRFGYGVVAIASHLGADRTAGTTIMILLSAALVGLGTWLGRRGRQEAALLVAIDLVLIGSPLVWIHYFALLIVPLAILRPRLSREWLLALLLWLCPGGLRVSAWQAAFAAIMTAAITYLLLRSAGAHDEVGPPSEQRGSGQLHVLATPQGGERAGQPLAARQT